MPEADSMVGDYLYIVAWDDSATTQGVLGQFARVGGETIYTGTGAWEVCATGVRYESGTGTGGPSLDVINAQILLCNGGATDPSTTSAGWVDATGTAAGKLQAGEDNSTAGSATPGNEFGIVCGIDAAARWMWFNWDPTNIVWPTQSPFIWSYSGGSNPDKQFLIFRLQADIVP